MIRYGSYSDDHYVNMNLNTEMELPHNRETVLHYFEQVQKQFPSMKNFYSRERGEFVLEEEKESGNYRWTSIETRRICSGFVNPPSVEDMRQIALGGEKMPQKSTFYYPKILSGLVLWSLNDYRP